ncbi:dCMP deaminase [Streptomonospora salina]|uniref:Diaminohydroxyphosphoribosylaminopyrimidine deaminase/5-amino-6-(5-phosphoribosylamino)uracil reductase n=1 Tax=Streptomonospora salina TaxID=104205 RepID=A0A841E1S8_9ACTN|nr:dCMP deaminase [Streptomonospora salina]MBB5997085.1 diaminohydroxyphosphoribosylaminopyrimidine deaminase/5-amino-6-(5-phosphoribosylamino)uracil reductase [Streptomonospora salina]
MNPSLSPTPTETGPRPGTGPDPTDADRYWLRAAVALSRRCPPSAAAFSVGAILVDAGGAVVADGYSRRDDPADHAEEAALRSLAPDDPRSASATLYSSLEPCAERTSRTSPCSDLILATAVPRVVIAWREPALFVDAEGVERLRRAGRTVVEDAALAEEAREVNAHLLA